MKNILLILAFLVSSSFAQDTGVGNTHSLVAYDTVTVKGEITYRFVDIDKTKCDYEQCATIDIEIITDATKKGAVKSLVISVMTFELKKREMLIYHIRFYKYTPQGFELKAALGEPGKPASGTWRMIPEGKPYDKALNYLIKNQKKFRSGIEI